MKCTLTITQNCNLACSYCYITKKDARMPLATAKKIVDFIFNHCPPDEKIDFGFFGGEPLLEFELIQDITGLIKNHPGYSPGFVSFTITTNGTVLNDRIIKFLLDSGTVFCISCDGPPDIQDLNRRSPDGRGSSGTVEENIRRALSFFPLTPVNAVYSPETVGVLPEIVEYLASLGVQRIFLNPDISSPWTQKEAEILPRVFGQLGTMHLDFHLQGKPRYISLIDNKIAVILRGGYQPLEKCRMGDGELAFAPSGNVYPCERLIGSDDGKRHCLGNIDNHVDLKKRCHHIPTEAVNTECLDCELSGYCMNWCGCTNHAMTGKYNMAPPFICAAEKAAIRVALEVIQGAADNHINLSSHLVEAVASDVPII